MAIKKPLCLDSMNVTLFEKWCRKYDVEMVILFGSHAKDLARPDSDIDLGILLAKHPIPVEEELQLCLDLVGAVQTSKVDMVILNHADPFLCYEAACHGIVICEKHPSIFDRFKVMAFKRFVDTEPFRQLNDLYFDMFLMKGKSKMRNRGVIYQKLARVVEYLSELEELTQYSFEEYEADFKIKRAVERDIELIVEFASEVNGLIIVGSGEPPPADYFSSFIKMGRLEVLPTDFAQSLAHTASIRNRLVHEYETVIDQLVYAGAQTIVTSFRRYIELVRNYLREALHEVSAERSEQT
ncbi:MAG: HepT-like ribonuclease domain-containing protein [Candidatus Poribacteria bacterium]